MALNILLVIVAYLLGSIPSAVWIGKRFYGIDVREHGSHNAGATNTLRTLGRRAALPVFAIDILKGFTAVMLSHLSGYAPGSDAMFNFKIMLVAAAVVGHIFLRRVQGWQGRRHTGRRRRRSLPSRRRAMPHRFYNRTGTLALRIAQLDERRNRLPDLYRPRFR